MAADPSTIHASAVLVGPKAVLIRGLSGSGKSQLAWDLLQAATQGALPFARLIGDDRVHVEPRAGRLLVWSNPALTGLIEIRGFGIRRLDYEPVAVVRLVVDLGAADAERYPLPGADRTTIEGVALPRIAVAPGTEPLPAVFAFLRTAPGTAPGGD